MLSAIIAGLIVGALAKLVMPGRDPGGIIVTIIIGILGAIVGTFLGRSLGFYDANEGAGIIMSILGAMLLLFLYRVLQRRRAIP
ncbi:MAG TPA: GlsB/YeaQ/YmgE family stress response membrane protein [Gemmatimonadaceae bacterium]|nr:GlsB/YeaQ/YmgE family stress response membrane protein [Gemmatimonadaceae bacterium]